MQVTTYLIPGVMVGFEVVSGDDDWKHCIVVDLLILRVMFHWGKEHLDED